MTHFLVAEKAKRADPKKLFAFAVFAPSSGRCAVPSRLIFGNSGVSLGPIVCRGYHYTLVLVQMYNNVLHTSQREQCFALFVRTFLSRRDYIHDLHWSTLGRLSDNFILKIKHFVSFLSPVRRHRRRAPFFFFLFTWRRRLPSRTFIVFSRSHSFCFSWGVRAALDHIGNGPRLIGAALASLMTKKRGV